MSLPSELSQVISGEVLSDTETLERYSHDASLFAVKPSVVVYPLDAADISKLVHFAHQNLDRHISLTARSGGTCMSGGPLSTSLVLDISKHMNRSISVNESFATVQPGMFYRDFEVETLKHGVLMPSYPASRDIATVGGMVANNAGGEKTLSYGKVEKYVTQLKVILQDGNEYTVAPLDKTELQEKLSLQTFEGDMYRRVYELIEKDFDLIQNARPSVTKNAAGYHLWNVWDRQTFDLTQLFVGSQGTLGIITEITFRLIKPKPHTQMLVVFMKDFTELAEVVKRVLTYHPESFESYDNHTLQIAMKALPGLIKQMGGKNLFSLGLQFLPELKMVLSGGLPELVLIAEFTGHNKTEVYKRAQAAQAALKTTTVTTRLIKSELEAKKYWTIRRESFNLLRHKIKDKHTAPFIDDLCIHPKDLPEFLPKLTAILNKYNVIYTVAGHIGDANFHIIPLMDFSDPEVRHIIPDMAKEVYDLVFAYKGSMSGEHNDGLIRTPFLSQMYGEQIYNLFVQTKQIFDPNNIFNPGKKIGTTLEEALKYLRKD